MLCYQHVQIVPTLLTESIILHGLQSQAILGCMRFHIPLEAAPQDSFVVGKASPRWHGQVFKLWFIEGSSHTYRSQFNLVWTRPVCLDELKLRKVNYWKIITNCHIFSKTYQNNVFQKGVKFTHSIVKIKCISH